MYNTATTKMLQNAEEIVKPQSATPIQGGARAISADLRSNLIMATALSLSSRPEKAPWEEYLESLTEWQEFAILLPEIQKSDVEKIEADSAEITGVYRKKKQEKMDLWTKWTSVYPSGTWGDVVAALKKAKENELAEEIEKEFKKEEGI